VAARDQSPTKAAAWRLEAAEQDIDALDLRIAERLERSTSFHQFRC
jgi:hypothetical protein